MRSVVLAHYCPWPPTTGTRVEMMKHLDVLKALGPCTIASARGKPVGFGWTPEATRALREQGYTLVFREDTESLTAAQCPGFLYAALCNTLRLDKAFGHSNPYHRYAFGEAWWRRVTQGADLAVMNYSFWARFRPSCPQAIVTHEVLSNYHWSGARRETDELRHNELVLTVACDEAEALKQRGLAAVLWSPPAVTPMALDVTAQIGLIGTLAPQNIEGLSWLEQAAHVAEAPVVHVYGNLGTLARAPFLRPVGTYADRYDPFRACGIQLLTRGDRPGVQIKAVEALACGRAIVARRGSMRGLPADAGAWIEVATPREMLETARRLESDAAARNELAARARSYYARHLASDLILARLKAAYVACAKHAAPAADGAGQLQISP